MQVILHISTGIKDAELFHMYLLCSCNPHVWEGSLSCFHKSPSWFLWGLSSHLSTLFCSPSITYTSFFKTNSKMFSEGSIFYSSIWDLLWENSFLIIEKTDWVKQWFPSPFLTYASPLPNNILCKSWIHKIEAGCSVWSSGGSRLQSHLPHGLCLAPCSRPWATSCEA